jgi:hypothetical protein
VSFRPKSNIALSKAKTCGYACRDVMRRQDPHFWNHLRSIAGNGKGRKRPDMVKYGEANPEWKGGITFKRNKGNYIGPKYVRCPIEFINMARKDGYVMEHRLVMAIHLGRLLDRVEVVHHKDHNTRNNDIKNLELFPNNAAHKRAEGEEERARKAEEARSRMETT